MPSVEQEVVTLLGITKEDGEAVLKTLRDIQVHEEGIYPLLKATASQFKDKRALFAGWLLGHMVAKMHFEDCSKED